MLVPIILKNVATYESSWETAKKILSFIHSFPPSLLPGSDAADGHPNGGQEVHDEPSGLLRDAHLLVE